MIQSVNENNVPKGWKRDEVIRKRGVNKGKIDIYITSPKGKVFRSKKELSQYIHEKNLNLKIEDFNFSIKKSSMNVNTDSYLNLRNSSSDSKKCFVAQKSTEPILSQSLGTNHTPFSSTPTPSQQNTLSGSTPRDSSPEVMSTPSLTELISPHVTLTPEPPKFCKVEDENSYLRQRVAELKYINAALTDKIIDLEKQALEFGNANQGVKKITIALQTEESSQISKKEEDVCQMPYVTNTQKTQELVTTSTQTDIYAIESLTGIHILETDMCEVISQLKYNGAVAFAHSISGDFHHPRQMTAGVAVIFRKCFGKPEEKDLLSKHLTCQRTVDGASVYSLVTKANFNGKPTVEAYDSAFEEFTNEFQKSGFSTLICSPMGCVRDLITLDHFSKNIVKFHRATGATVLVVTGDKTAQRVRKHGLPQAEFVKRLRREIQKAEDSKVQVLNPVYEEREEVNARERDTEGWYQLEDEDIKLYLDQLVSVPENVLLLDPVIGHLLQRCEDAEEILQVRASQDFDTYDYVLAPVNDRINDETEGGGHWSLLLYTRNTNTFYHLDSLEPHNQRHAEQLAARISGDPHVNVVQMRGCRQRSHVECGAYVLRFCELTCAMIRNNLSIQDYRCYSQGFSVNKIYNSLKQLKNRSKYKKVESVKQKVVLLSDSHGRRLNYILKKRFQGEVFSMVKPNATIEQVAGGLDGELRNLGSKDHLVILGGTNDICSGTDINVKSTMRNIALKTKHTNVIICTIPLRYDRLDLNGKIRKTNIDLVMEAMKYDHFKVLSLSNISTSMYTYHGLHLNNWGKNKLCNLIVDKIDESHLN